MKKETVFAALTGLLFACCGQEKNVCFKDMWLEKDTVKREKLQDIMQSCIDRITKKEFDSFDNAPEKSSSNPVLKYYDQALGRIAKEIPETRVKPGNAVIWYLYNMGFVIKTPTVCFGVDIHHRHAEKLEPFLDFLAVTHNHNDHYSMPLMRKMNAAQKPVVSNFFPNYAYTKARSFVHEIKGVKIYCSEADHNAKLKKFTMPMEFVCPTGDKSFVFFTSGDCFSHDFLNKVSDRIDLYALHPRCGMIPVKAAEKLAPEVTFIGHLQELGHDINVWRWQFSVGREEVEAIKKIKRQAVVPVWGEKFLWDGEKLHGCQK
ncbi:MAG: MBL fold metallo-hydrolase [Lentisphaeria bacterium]|nr:MBL fold metallo-hydrolase [Lentisphaeria bacterium]